MNVITRGIRNAFRNITRTLSIVVILGLSIGLSLSMLVAHKAVNKKIDSVRSSISNTITITPAGFRGFQGGGNPLTTDQLAKISKLDHISKIDESISDRLNSSDTSLVSAIDAGSLGQRFGGFEGFGGGFNNSTDMPVRTFTPPITAIGTTNTASLDGSNLTLISGSQINGSQDSNNVLVGSTLATKNSLKVGSTFTAYNTTLTVAGIFDANTTFSNNQVIFSLPTLQRLSSQTNEITSTTAYVDSINNMDTATTAVKNALGSAADVTSSKDMADNAIEPLQSIQKVSLFSLIGAVIAGGVIILLTMVMIVRERQREIGVLKAIGGSNLKIMIQFMIESLTLALLGAIIGLAIGVVGGQPVTKMLVNNSTNSQVMNVASPGRQGNFGGNRALMNNTDGPAHSFGARFRQNGTVRSFSNIKTEIGWSIIVDGLGAAVFIALLGSALSASLISKVRPSQVMRTE